MPYGVEALSVMRIEKGHVAGGELNGTTTAGDLGLGKMMSTQEGLYRPHDGGARGPRRSRIASRWSASGRSIPAIDCAAIRYVYGRFVHCLTKVIGWGWNSMTSIEPAGDLNRDGVPDLIVRNANGNLLLYRMTRSLGFMAPAVQIGAGWQGMASIVGAGAFASGLNGDVVALTADHALSLYRADASGKLAYGGVMATGQDDLVQLLGVGDLNGDAKPDVLGVRPTARCGCTPETGPAGCCPAGNRSAVDRGPAMLWAKRFGAVRVLSMAAAGVVAAGTGLVASGPAGAVEIYPRPFTNTVALTGHGYGHGHGMSQWGAYGAAQVHKLSWQNILDFYYPGTKLDEHR